MRCPYCGDEMRSGYLQCTHRFYWSEEKARILMIPGKGDIEVGQGDWAGCNAYADYCSRCKKIIIPVD